jgi:hypothetical protein
MIGFFVESPTVSWSYQGNEYWVKIPISKEAATPSQLISFLMTPLWRTHYLPHTPDSPACFPDFSSSFLPASLGIAFHEDNHLYFRLISPCLELFLPAWSSQL